MPPRIQLISHFYPTSLRTTSISSFLLPFLHPQTQHTRNASVLSSLSDVPAAYNKRIRRGRGASSGKGKTSGRGHKGQKQHGKVPRGFNGGQTPIEVVHGKRGFDNQFSVDMSPINLDRIQSWIDQGRLDISKPITIKELNESRCLHGIKDGVKLLARNSDHLTAPIHITVSRASSSAIAAVEAAGGTVQTRYYTPASVRRVLRGHSHPTQSLLSADTDPAAADDATKAAASALAATLPSPAAFRYRLPDPTARKDLEYYRDPAHRGYLSYQVAPGQGPSLFFKTPAEVAAGGIRKRAGKAAGVAAKGEGRIW